MSDLSPPTIDDRADRINLRSQRSSHAGSVDLDRLRKLNDRWHGRDWRHMLPGDYIGLANQLPAIIAALERAARLEAVREAAQEMAWGFEKSYATRLAALRAALAAASDGEG